MRLRQMAVACTTFVQPATSSPLLTVMVVSRSI
ncbi:hypothetical protein J2S17_005327 [Cytobacillus purgationiresistens]|uniref:Uncharacterized protein n=1 Tax=Cytobacillus purgationiresistens TaxID=863449 RepID=A0ABU0ATN0_9BACI|nr:hypothetical protein [Cytobacillus purgationiresistens]